MMSRARWWTLIVLAVIMTGSAFLLLSALEKKLPAQTLPPTAPSAGTPPPTPTPSPTPKGISDGPIGFIGCSNSRDAVQGYRAVGGKRIWNPPTQTTYGGGTVVAWSNAIGNPEVKYWKEFDAMNTADPGAKTLWLSLCLRAAESDSASYTAAISVINEIKRKIPSITIYVSALNGFVEPHACSIAGKNGPLRAQVLADRLVSEGRAKTGPDVGDLISDDQIPSAGATAQNTETINDGCHPSTERGEPKLGRELLKFFPN